MVTVTGPNGEHNQSLFKTSLPPKKDPRPPDLRASGGTPILPFPDRLRRAEEAERRADARLKALGDKAPAAPAAMRALAVLALEDAKADLANAKLLAFTVTSSAALTRLRYDEMKLENLDKKGTNYKDKLRKWIKLVSPKEIRVKLGTEVADGRYKLEIPFKYGKFEDDKDGTGKVYFTVEKHLAEKEATATGEAGKAGAR